MLSDDAIKEYQKIYKDLYGEDLPWEEATMQATNLIGLYKAVYKIPRGNNGTNPSQTIPC